jgi:hypothetical protein
MLVCVTPGDQSAQQTSPPRGTPRPTPKKANGATAKEARTSGAGKTGAVKKRAPRAATPKREADVLERLNKLSEPQPVDEALSPMPIALPAIVEADPSFPLPAPSAEQIAKADVADLPAPVGAPVSPNGHAEAASAPTAASTASSVSSDLATEAVPAAPAATMPVLLAPDVVPPIAPDRTETVPLVVPAPAPTEAMPQAVLGEDVDGSFGLVLPQRPLQRPIAFRKGKPRVRRVTRVIRHVDTWSVFKVALVFNAILFLTCLTSGVLLWNVAHATGTVDNVEKFFEQFGWSSFEFNGGALYHNAWVAGLFVAIGLTGFAVLLATLFNLITDLVGGIRVSVLEEEVVARSSLSPVAKARLWYSADREQTVDAAPVVREHGEPTEPG